MTEKISVYVTPVRDATLPPQRIPVRVVSKEIPVVVPKPKAEVVEDERSLEEIIISLSQGGDA